MTCGPAEWDRIRAEPGRARAVGEEGLRWATPSQTAALTVLDRTRPRYNASFMVRGLTGLPVRVRRRG